MQIAIIAVFLSFFVTVQAAQFHDLGCVGVPDTDCYPTLVPVLQELTLMEMAKRARSDPGQSPHFGLPFYDSEAESPRYQSE